ncbi:PREDICTED: mutS protein homolog 4-like [Dinoponera quadriceps]|uniref:MutS protein homolog 4-like n=1 Tax=Dinoponera quadriceps TaxID=609295 RepID=A0A6P3X6Y1_DINQU|nr:PREDICTED: mutS protein homolog 4-like [Dinoponera quadriceps]
MNVIQPVPPRGRRGFPRGRIAIPNAQRFTNLFPKHQFEAGFSKPSTSSGPASSVTKTPRRNWGRNVKENCVSTSSYLSSVSRRSTGSTNAAKSSVGTSSHADSSVVIALTAGRGDARNEVGLAAIDLQYPYLILCQISDCQIYVNTLTKIHILDPIEILMPETMCQRRGCLNKLYKLIKEKFNALKITPILRMHFNESNGMERVRTLCAKEYSSVELIVKQKYYALAAAAALLKYVEYAQHMVYAPRSVRMEFQGSPNTTMIDIESARSLELVVSQSKHFIVSLLGTMDRCLTPMGRRLLRASILQPPCDERLIAERQSCVAELVANRSLCASLQPVVQRLFGTDRLLTLASKPLNTNDIQNAERNLNYALLLKSCLDTVPELEAVLATGIHTFFVKMRKNLGNYEFQVMKDKIMTLIHTDARFVKGSTSSSVQRCFAIKAGINELLDVARQVYCELINDMKNLVEASAVKHKLPLSLEYNVNLGYHIQMVVPRCLDISDLSTEFIQVRKNRRSFTMTTAALLTLNKQCRKACEEIYVMSNTLLTHLLEDIRQHVGCLFQLSADVAELDLVLSLAQISSNPEYVRPSFGMKLELRDSLHPIMELFNTDLPVPNDVDATNAYNFHLITGPNMSGKSTYLKQIILLQIMAQIGSYVPATEATFRIADRIFCRICSRDDAELNASAYVLEMKEAQYILQSVTPRSLVVLDELCRHTTVEEGSAIAWSICEKLLLTSAFTFAVTHFLHLTALRDMYHNVTTHCFQTKTAESDDSGQLRLIYTHKLNNGTAPADHYGIALAEVSSLPKCVTSKAREYASRQSADAQSNLRSVTDYVSWGKSCYDAAVQLHVLLENNRFVFANIISTMKQLDLGKQRKTLVSCAKTQPTSQVLAQQPAANSLATLQTAHEEQQHCQEAAENHPVETSFAPKDNPALVEPTNQRGEHRAGASGIESNAKEFPRIAGEPANDRNKDSPEPEGIANRRATLPFPNNLVEESSSVVSPRDTVSTSSPNSANLLSVSQMCGVNAMETSSLRSISHGSVTDDPLFYVCTSFARTSSQKSTMILSRCENNLESNLDISSLPPSLSLRSSQSFPYHDYCLSEREFNITPPSQPLSTPTEVARINARVKEADIFRQIEGRAFDEAAFFNSTQVPIRINLTNDDDVAMLPA